MVFYSHSKKKHDGTTIGTKLLIEHIRNVIENAGSRIYCELFSKNEYNDYKNLLEFILKYHDFGKYTSYFQNYLLGSKKSNTLLKQHSKIGGVVAYNSLKDINITSAIAAYFLISQHHSNLIDIEQIPHQLDKNIEEIINHQFNDINKNISQIKEELDDNILEDKLSLFSQKEFKQNIRKLTRKEQNIKYYFLFNYLFSLLIESDKLDASVTPIYKLNCLNTDAVDKRFDSYDVLPKYLTGLSNNELRSYCRAKVLKNITNENILDFSIFTLTAPTGIGKTMTALDFALKLKEKIYRKNNYIPQIIYALPFINIIEQAVKEYEDTLGNKVKVLAHYQFTDILGSSNEDDEKNYNQKLMSLETWQSDIVITSFVQFFETLIGNRNKLLKKFNHYAGSIIILDEVQTLKLEHMPLMGAALYYLGKYLDAKIILMTATRPKILELTQREILIHENEKLISIELLENYEDIFKLFERTKIINCFNIEFEKNEVPSDFYNKLFKLNCGFGKSCLIVVNKVNRAIEIFDYIKHELNNEKLDNPIYCLSTNIIPAHRFDTIKEIKKDIDSNRAPILVSTQVVEAGVDLDFDMGFRDLGPVDSIIQVAGRINRNNDPNKKYSPLFVVDFNDCTKIYGRITYIQSKNAIMQKEYFTENEYLELITNYFDNISDTSSFDNSKKFFYSMKGLKYTSDNASDFPISDFKIINESKNTSSVFIEIDDIATNCKEKYVKMINGEINKEDFEPFKRDFNQRIIAVPNYYLNSLRMENGTELSDNLLIVPKELLNKYYNNETGFIRSIKDADETAMIML